MITDADIQAFLKGEPAPPPVDVLKDIAVSDVHVSSAEDDNAKAFVEGKSVIEREPKSPADVEKALAHSAEVFKNLGRDGMIAVIAKVDATFTKGEANLYVSRPLTEGSAKRLHAWAAEQGIPNLVPPELMHVTVAHSTAEVDTSKITPDPSLLDIDVESRWLGRLGKNDEAVVLQFWSKDLQDRFRQFMGAGASWDFPSYMPHITLSYAADPTPPKPDAKAIPGPDVWSMLEAPHDPLQLGPEVWAKSNDNWTKDNNLAKGEFSLPIKVTKVEPTQRMIFGWASVAAVNGVEVIDKQGDIIPVVELEKAAYEFTLYSRQHGDMHSKVGTGLLVESMMFTPEKEALGLVAKNEKGEIMHGWWTGFRVDDPKTWEAVKSNKMPEFSIGGKATPVEVP